MIGSLCGKIQQLDPTHLLLEVGGIGYSITIPIGVYEKLYALSSNEKEHVTLYTHLQISDNAHLLYGFLTLEEKEMFLLLISVSNVGPSIGIRMLSAMPLKELQRVIGHKEVGLIQQIKGLGKKTAERIVLELADKMSGLIAASDMESGHRVASQEADAAIQALISLGFSQSDAQKKVYAALQKASTTTPLSVESIVKHILQLHG